MIEECQEPGDLAKVDYFFSPQFVNRAEVPGVPADREGVRIIFGAFKAAFPDLRIVVHDQVAEGDRVVTRKSFHGTHQGDFMGIPPTGKQVAFDVIDILRVEDGKLAEHWNVVDQLGLMQQLGVVPA
jgi:steroid delta-isomerase-like uncharacterized protein